MFKQLILSILTLSSLSLSARNSLLAQEGDQGHKPTAKYIGSESCSDCHQAQFKNWRNSHHALAMQVANDSTVLAPFDGRNLAKNTDVFKPFKEHGKFYVSTNARSSKIERFKITHVIGVYPLQQYLVEYQKGAYQVLRYAWDTRALKDGGQKWFPFPDEQAASSTDRLHWTRIEQNWNSMCAECHVTNYKKNYSTDNYSFASSYSEIGVGCESCHGPGSRHVEIAKRSSKEQSLEEKPTKLKNSILSLNAKKIPSPKPLRALVGVDLKRSQDQVEACAQCHSRRAPLTAQHIHGKALADTHRVNLLEAGLYHPDGQILDEVYEYGSFMQSKMYKAGVTCSHCHDPHNANLLSDTKTLCLSCHQAESYNTPKHHHHKLGTQGAQCINCHMPEKVYMSVDGRRDHSFRIPMPERSNSLNSPDACKSCHMNQSWSWLIESYKKMYPSRVSDSFDYGVTFYNARKGLKNSQAALLKIINDSAQPAIVRATAISEIVRFVSPHTLQVITNTLSDKDPLVRQASVSIFEGQQDPRLIAELFNLLDDPILSVRFEAARVLASARDLTQDQLKVKKLELVLKQYTDSLILNGERAYAWFNLGNLKEALRDPDQAEIYYAKAMMLEPFFDLAFVNQAQLLYQKGDKERSLKTLLLGLESSKDSLELRYSLAMYFIREKDYPKALKQLELAAKKVSPEDAIYEQLITALVLTHEKIGSLDRALSLLKSSLNEQGFNQQLAELGVALASKANKAEEIRFFSERLQN